MIRVILGEKGTGKTKMLLDSVHAAVESEKGNVVFINNGSQHITDVSHKIRLVDTSEFSIKNYEEFYGLVCGILAQNYDVSYIFVDSITKIASGEEAALEELLEKLEAICQKFEVQIAMTISMSVADASEKIKKFA
ncbi:MAG: twitching motility protein PilT [Ruminococcaceae bacterium]|nr:twitching motility protein PilT [Oscillospiraceae bacterium]